MNSPDPSPQLEYAPRPPLRRRIRIYRWLIAVTIIASIYFGRNFPYEVWHHFQLLALERQCTKHPIPAGTVVYSSDNPAAAIVSPEAAALYAATVKDYRWGLFRGRAGTHATFFAGEVSRGYGTSEFVTIEATTSFRRLGDTRDADLWLVINEFTPKLTNQIEYNHSEGLGSYPSVQSPGPPLVVYSATRDAIDPSHIHLRYCLCDKEYEMDGHLDRNGQFTLAVERTRAR